MPLLTIKAEDVLPGDRLANSDCVQYVDMVDGKVRLVTASGRQELLAPKVNVKVLNEPDDIRGFLEGR